MSRVTKIFALAATAALALTACGGSNTTTPSATGGSASAKPKIKVGLAYDIGGRGDKSFNDSAAVGLDKAKADLGVEVKELSATGGETDKDKEQRLRLLAQSGHNPVIAVGFLYQASVAAVAKEFPKVQFGLIDATVEGAANVTGLVFAEEEGSFLVGAAAALKSKTGSVAFIGGCDLDLIKKFQAGFEQGAKAAKPNVKVASAYLSTPAEKCSGFNDPAKGELVAKGQYDAGADVIFAAAGGSGTGVFKAAKEKKTFAIGVDSDQYLSASADLQPVIYTSMLKRVNVAVFEFIKSMNAGTPLTGVTVFNLEKDGVGYSTSGDFIDATVAGQLEKFKQDIVAGTIKVDTKPKG